MYNKLKKIQKDVWQNKLNKGFNTTDVNKEFCLLYGEVSEAYDAWKKKKDDLNEELADIAIYLMGLSEMLRENNVKMGSFYPYDDTNIVNPYAIYLNQFVKRSVFVKHMLSK